MDTPEIPPVEPVLTVPRKYGRRQWLLLAAGFIAWYLVNGLIWMALNSGGQSNVAIVNILIFPFHFLVILILAVIRATRPFGVGLVAAVSVNLVISLGMGLLFNAICFVPFFSDVK